MENLLNSAWLLIVLALFASWVFALVGRSSRTDPSRPSWQLQLTALLVLIVLLFPVISMTDDLAACTAPQEAERALRLHDPTLDVVLHQVFLPNALAWTDRIAAMLQTGTSQPVEYEACLVHLLDGNPLPLDSRPPPKA